MLSEMVRAEEFFARVALPELVNVLEMPDTLVPVQIRDVSGRRSARRLPGAREFFSAIPACVRLAGVSSAIVESAVVAR